MKLSGLKGTYETASETLGQNVRTLALSGIAVVWVFRVSDRDLPSDLVLPLVLMTLTLAFDLLQYVVHTLVYFLYFRRKEEEFESVKANFTRETWDFAGSVWATRPAWGFFWVKTITLILGYAFLLVYLFGVWGSNGDTAASSAANPSRSATAAAELPSRPPPPPPPVKKKKTVMPPGKKPESAWDSQ